MERQAEIVGALEAFDALTIDIIDREIEMATNYLIQLRNLRAAKTGEPLAVEQEQPKVRKKRTKRTTEAPATPNGDGTAQVS